MVSGKGSVYIDGTGVGVGVGVIFLVGFYYSGEDPRWSFMRTSLSQGVPLCSVCSQPVQ